MKRYGSNGINPPTKYPMDIVHADVYARDSAAVSGRSWWKRSRNAVAVAGWDERWWTKPDRTSEGTSYGERVSRIMEAVSNGEERTRAAVSAAVVV